MRSTLEQLHEFQVKVWEARHPALEEVYSQNTDNRRLRGAGVETSAELRELFGRTREITRGNATLDRIARDGHCHEAVMWLVHHVPTAEQTRLISVNSPAPLLPEQSSPEKKTCADATGTHKEVCAGAEAKDTCSWCHNKQSDPDIIPDAHDPSMVGPDDLNPHGWDRMRRCDQDYKAGSKAKGGFEDGPCGPCEGIGGIAWGDKNDQISIPSCSVVKLPHEVDQSKLAKPVFPKKYTVKFWEVLIGVKTDPFCFAFFPGPDSQGNLCYRKEEGTNFYDIENEAAAFHYPEVKLPLPPFSYGPNISSKVIHVQDRMWVVNTLYGGVEQCICTNPAPHDAAHGGDHGWHTYPTRYDFAYSKKVKAEYMGRVKLDVEYHWQEMELDHWNLWAHHIFIHPVNGQIVRMWKPWNGLQVYPIGGWNSTVEDDSVFNVPPPQCKKGGAHIRITCDDDGHYMPKNDTEHVDFFDQMRALYAAFEPKEVLV